MPKDQLTVLKGEVVVPEGVFVAFNAKGQLVQITEDDFEVVKGYMLVGLGFYNIAKKLREDHERPDITFGALRYFIDIIDKVAYGIPVDFPIPDWMYGAAAGFLETREAMRDLMYEKLTMAALAGDRQAFQFILRQDRSLVGLPEDIPETPKPSRNAKNAKSAKVVPINRPMTKVSSEDLESAIEQKQQELDNRSKQNAAS